MEHQAADAWMAVPYTWQQDEGGEATITWQLPSDSPIRSADVRCSIKPNRFRLSVRGLPDLDCDRTIARTVDPEESCWTLDHSKGRAELVVTLVPRDSGRNGFSSSRAWQRLWDEDDEEEKKNGEAPRAALPRSFVVGSVEDDGNTDLQERVTDQLHAEQVLESKYHKLLEERGGHDEESLDTFFLLFNEKIQLYRLDELDSYLRTVVPDCRRRGGEYEIKAIQALSFVRWKQGRHKEALDLFVEIEKKIGGADPSLSENIAHTHCALGELRAAEKRFREAIDLCESRGGEARASSFLGLAIMYEKSGKLQEARRMAQRSYTSYSQAAQGRPSSLVAKAGTALARILLSLGVEETQRAEELYKEAINVYEVTCGAESPLLVEVCKQLGQLLVRKQRVPEAREYLFRAYDLSTKKDAWNPDEIVPLHCQLMSTHTVGVEMVDRAEFTRYFNLADNLVGQVRAALDATKIRKHHAGILCKLAAEIRLWGADYKAAHLLLHEALELFEAEGSKAQVKIIISTCEECMQHEPPLLIPIACKEYKFLRPPVPSSSSLVKTAISEVGKTTASSQLLGASVPSSASAVTGSSESACKGESASSSLAASAALPNSTMRWQMQCGVTLTAWPPLDAKSSIRCP